MAIVKMQKFNLLIFDQAKEAVLEKLQDFQNVELFAADTYYDHRPTEFSRIKGDSQAEELELTLSKIIWARNFLSQYLPKPTFLENLRKPIQRYTLAQLAAHTESYPWEEIYQELRQKDKRLRTLEQERQELSTQEDDLNKWRYFEERPAILKTFQHTNGLLGTVPNSELSTLQQELDHLATAYYEIIYQSSTTSYLFILCHKEEQVALKQILRQGFEEYHYPFTEQPSHDLQTIKTQAAALVAEEKRLKQELKEYAADYQSLGMVAEYYDSLRIRVANKNHLLASNYTTNFAGWVPVDQMAIFTKQIEKAVGADYYLEFKDVVEEEFENVPILLKNGPLVKPFEALVRMYNLPQYNELDPTPFMAPFYAMAFGMMVADFGYGLLLFLAILIAKKLFHFKESMLQSLTMFQIVAVPTMFWGLIYGNIFGFEFSFQLLSSSQNITEILVLSVIFGYIQILFALGLNFYILWKKKNDKWRALLQSGSWIAFLLSILVIVIGMVFLTQGPLTMLGMIGLIVSILLIIIGGGMDGTTVASKIGSGLYGLMDITSYLGDLVSYTRLMALGVAGGSIAAAFNLIIGYLPVGARFTVGILLFVALHSLNIFLSYLSAYVHGIRLQYLEFFGKFFAGGGKEFKKLKASEKYVEIISEQQEEE